MNPGNWIFLARHELMRFLKERETLLWLFVMPIVFFWFIGSVTSGFGGGPGKAEALPLWVSLPEESGVYSSRLVERLESNGFAVQRTENAQELANAPRHLVLPSNFDERIVAAELSKFELIHHKESLKNDQDFIQVARASYGLLAEIAALPPGAPPSEEQFAALDAEPAVLRIESRLHTERLDIPSGFEQAVPGIMVMFALMSLLTGGAAPLVIERREGVLERLAASPLSRLDIVLGKWLGRLGLAILQTVYAMLMGWLLFGVGYGQHLGTVLALLLAWSAFCASAGLLLGTLCRTEGQAVGLGVLVGNLLAALGGCWWPVEVTPEFMQQLASFLPTGWTMNGLHALVHFGRGPEAAVFPIALLLGSAGLLIVLASRRLQLGR